jgi:hypothetical protein
MLSTPAQPRVELVLHGALDDQPGTQLRDLRQRPTPVHTQPHRQQPIDPRFYLRRWRWLLQQLGDATAVPGHHPATPSSEKEAHPAGSEALSSWTRGRRPGHAIGRRAALGFVERQERRRRSTDGVSASPRMS